MELQSYSALVTEYFIQYVDNYPPCNTPLLLSIFINLSCYLYVTLNLSGYFYGETEALWGFMNQYVLWDCLI